MLTDGTAIRYERRNGCWKTNARGRLLTEEHGDGTTDTAVGARYEGSLTIKFPNEGVH